jgi:addiction module HigA family antidote
MLLEEFLLPMRLTPQQLAAAIDLPLPHLDALIRGEQDLTPPVALRLANYFGTTPDFWLNLQLHWDLYFNPTP